jgi:hypothetical protein
MNRIVILRFDLFGPATVAPAFVNKTSGLLRRRHVSGNYFAYNVAGRPSVADCLTGRGLDSVITRGGCGDSKRVGLSILSGTGETERVLDEGAIIGETGC